MLRISPFSIGQNRRHTAQQPRSFPSSLLYTGSGREVRGTKAWMCSAQVKCHSKSSLWALEFQHQASHKLPEKIRRTRRRSNEENSPDSKHTSKSLFTVLPKHLNVGYNLITLFVYDTPLTQIHFSYLGSFFRYSLLGERFSTLSKHR